MEYDILQTPNFHLGKEIAARIEEFGITKAEFGRRIGIQRGNVGPMLQRRDLPADRLLLISKILDKNFFETPIQSIEIEETEEEATKAPPKPLFTDLQRFIQALISIQNQL